MHKQSFNLYRGVIMFVNSQNTYNLELNKVQPAT
jgi:hypothetical protein